MDFKVNMSTKFEGPVWASLGIDMDTDHVERRAVLHLIREIYNPMLHDSLSKGNNWNSTFKGKKGFDIRRKLTARQNELPAIVRAHVPDPAELTERMYDVLRYYRFTDPAWKVVDMNYPIVEVVPLPAPAGGLAPRPPTAPAPVPGPGPALAPAPGPALSLAPAHISARVSANTPDRARRAPARARAPAPAPALAPAPVPANTPSRARRAPAHARAPAPAPALPVPAPVPAHVSTHVSARVPANTPDRARRAPAREPAPGPAPASIPAPAPGPALPVNPAAKAATEAIAKNSGGALTNTSAPLSTPSLSPGPIPSPGPLIQPSIGPNPDLPPLVAPEALHAPIPDEPQEGYYKADDMEAPSPPRIDLDAFTRTIERANRKRARDDDEDTHPPTPPKKRSNASRSPKENTEWTKFTTLGDSSSNEEQSLDADGDTLMDRKAKPYKVKNKSDEPDNSVWSTMRDYLGRMGREPTPQEQDEEL